MSQLNQLAFVHIYDDRIEVTPFDEPLRNILHESLNSDMDEFLGYQADLIRNYAESNQDYHFVGLWTIHYHVGEVCGFKDVSEEWYFEGVMDWDNLAEYTIWRPIHDLALKGE
jgi:hypothetical protein